MFSKVPQIDATEAAVPNALSPPSKGQQHSFHAQRGESK
jgi:hypothetical protein